MTPPPPYQALVLAGGGNRCIWQAGFWESAGPALGTPQVVAGVSAGACMACAIFAGRARGSLEYMLRQAARLDKNLYWRNLWRPEPLLPHFKVYRQGLLEILDQEALARLRQGPEVRILLARPPAWAGAVGGTLLGFACYFLEKHLKRPLHPTWSQRLGFRPVVVRADECRDGRELARLILASSSTPPIVPVQRWGGRPALDGGLVDNVPLLALKPQERPALVLLTRRHPPGLLQGHPGLTYVQPSRPIPVAKWDYTSPERLQAAFDLGRRDGEEFLRRQGL